MIRIGQQFEVRSSANVAVLIDVEMYREPEERKHMECTLIFDVFNPDGDRVGELHLSEAQVIKKIREKEMQVSMTRHHHTVNVRKEALRD